MPSFAGIAKRPSLGRPLRSTQPSETLLPTRVVLPVSESDALSSVAHAPEDILIVLSAAGLSCDQHSGWVAGAVVLLLLTVVASNRRNVHAYPSGGGDHEVGTVNLGPNAGLTVASALLVDYGLTVAVSLSSGVADIASAVSRLAPHKVAVSPSSSPC